MKTSIIVLLASLFVACGTREERYVVKGSLKDAGKGYAVLSVTDHTGKQVISDTAGMSGGKFRFMGTTPFVAVGYLRVVPEGKETLDLMMVLENSPIEIEGDWANLERDSEGNFFIRGITAKGGKNTEVSNVLDQVCYTIMELPGFKDYTRLEKWMNTIDEDHELTEADYQKLDTFQELHNSYVAKVFEEQLKIMAAHPSLEAAAYYLTPMIDGMKLEEFEEAFGKFDIAVQNGEMLAEIREKLETRRRLEPGRMAPAFALAQRDGQMLSLVDLRGKVLLVDFWASWCGPCRASFPWIREFYKKYNNKGVEILGVSVDDDKDSWERALDVEKLPWLHVRDEKLPNGERTASSLYRVEGIPHFVLIDREGKLVKQGHFEQQELEVLVDKLLTE